MFESLRIFPSKPENFTISICDDKHKYFQMFRIATCAGSKEFPKNSSKTKLKLAEQLSKRIKVDSFLLACSLNGPKILCNTNLNGNEKLQIWSKYQAKINEHFAPSRFISCSWKSLAMIKQKRKQYVRFYRNVAMTHSPVY